MAKLYRLSILMILFGLVFFLAGPGSAKDTDMSAACRQKHKAIEPANIDPTVRPADDFYRYVNGNWLVNNPVPSEYSHWGNFEQLAECNAIQLREIVESAVADKNAPKGSDVQKIGDFYASGMDDAGIETEGIAPLKNEFKRIADIADKRELPGVIAYFHSYDIHPLFGFDERQDPGNSGMTIAWLQQGGLGLPDRDYYTEENDRSKGIREEYVKHAARVFELLKETPGQAAQSAKVVMAIESRLAKVSMTRLERRDPKATYNKKTLEQLGQMTAPFDIAGYFTGVGLANPGDINVSQPEFFKELGKMLQEVGLEDWKTYLRWHLIRDTAGYLSSPFVDEDFRFNEAILSGSKELKPRWKRCLSTVNHSLGEAIGQLYVKKYFPPAAKTRAYRMVMNLKEALGERIKKLDWMSDETKLRALAKLAAFKVKIGYPDRWIDYSPLEIKRDSYVLNVMRANYFDFKRNLDKIGKPVDRGQWMMSPQTVNAYYHPMLNEIVFPAAILQQPFFDFRADDAVNYGGIGAAIGHEMTHGFDDQGRKYDKDGNLTDWWTKEDEERFNQRAALLEKQYDRYVVVDDARVDGKLTLGENIADIGGLSISYDAFIKTLEADMGVGRDPAAAKIDGFTPQQRFFLSWAQVWRENVRKESLLLRLKIDVHSPGKFRTIGPFSNLPAFYRAFDLKPGDAMYRPENEIVKIW